ncbi:hypothetical protein [Acetobacter sp. DsW_063]|uniref:hypothetical protein n=1 Tax=Acetobacter sp. DsW_063 TaxID=1514894 RepID=UPI001178C0CE|nr:hypothetical protein [Acetobacter sp. DsW_063]
MRASLIRLTARKAGRGDIRPVPAPLLSALLKNAPPTAIANATTDRSVDFPDAFPRVARSLSDRLRPAGRTRGHRSFSFYDQAYADRRDARGRNPRRRDGW